MPAAAAGRSSLADATAHLFNAQAQRIADPAIRRLLEGPGDQAMSSPPVPASARGHLAGTAEQQQAPNGPELDAIVDRVVAKIEQRVVDELERRGRRYTPGVF